MPGAPNHCTHHMDSLMHLTDVVLSITCQGYNKRISPPERDVVLLFCHLEKDRLHQMVPLTAV